MHARGRWWVLCLAALAGCAVPRLSSTPEETPLAVEASEPDAVVLENLFQRDMYHPFEKQRVHLCFSMQYLSCDGQRELHHFRLRPLKIGFSFCPELVNCH